MFTGIVEELGTVAKLEVGSGGALLAITAERVLADTGEGDSISVNGCCVTVTRLHEGAGGFDVDLMGETLARTGLGALREGDPVNLERALAAGGRLGGHLMQGHVDGVGRVTDVEAEEAWTLMTVVLPGELSRYVVEKGSVALDGVSLTVMGCDGESLSVGLIPHTLAVTTLGRRRPGDRMNVEVDVLAKYVERLLGAGVASPYEAGLQEG